MSEVRDYEGLGYETAAAAEHLLAANSEESFEETLRALLEETTGQELRVQTFEEAGVLTYNKGLVVRGPAGEFQLTINQSG